ncbi:MAG: hypothetical protein H8E31_15995 [Planctomycetes bacterium]|nr:hypothetical protein [Planctomycetota bacterium]
MSSGGRQPLHDQLDRLAGDAERGLRREAGRSQRASSARRRLVVAAAVLGLFALLQLSGRLAGAEALRLKAWPWAAAAAGLYGLAVALDTVRARRRRIRRQRALGEWDRQLGLQDRLTAADEFLGLAERSPFMEAAVADASAQLERTRRAGLRFDRAPTAGGPLPALPAALLLLMAGMLLGGWEAEAAFERSTAAALPSGGAPALEVAPEAEPPAQEPGVPEAAEEKEGQAPDREATAETHATSAGEEQDSRETEGLTGSGRSSAAESSTGAGSAQGSPSQQGQISKPGKKKTGAAKKKAPEKAPPKAGQKPEKNDEQESGSTAGRGSSRGSNRNPAASDWSSKDHVNTPDDDDLEEEDDVDDEEEDQESRGGMQPSLRDRKPPVSRDLSIGFGSQPNPDAKGRGGPSQPKKSRGTASLVLGVPIPDRVKGQPNPGKTKITQERVQPRAEPAPPAAAAERDPRQGAAAALRRQELAPWMRSLVRDYFLKLRQSTREET